MVAVSSRGEADMPRRDEDRRSSLRGSVFFFLCGEHLNLASAFGGECAKPLHGQRVHDGFREPFGPLRLIPEIFDPAHAPSPMERQFEANCFVPMTLDSRLIAG